MSESDTNQPGNFRTRLANIRHDLRTPVGHILGYSEILEEDLEDDPWPEFLGDLKHIHASGGRLVELIDELLGASKQSPDEIDIPYVQHQLRIQLNHISGYYELLRELAEDEDRQDVLPDLDKVGQASNNFLSILNRRLTPAAFLALAEEVGVKERESEALDSELELSEGVAPIETTPLGEGGDILIVDDNEANRDLLRRRLKRQGYLARTAADGQAALDYVASEPVDLILLDMIMPGLSGIDVLKQLKQDRVLRNIPVIMLSALDDVNPIIQCILMGAEDYVFKPYNPILLKARISATLEKYRLRKQQALKLKVFISSPGDVIPERRIVKSVLNQLNEELAGQVYLSPVLFEEEPLLASETFQSQIHPASDTDIYVGIMWARMGTPLPEHIRRADGSRYDSGSEYEFEDAMTGFNNNGRPDILVYRKIVDPVVTLTNREEVLDRLDQKERLEDFIQRWFQSADGESYVAAYHVFDSEDHFENLVATHLRKLALKRLAEGK